jgi:hypothetical protein
VETVNAKLQHTFRLDRERPHELSGLQARLAAKIALPNFCLWVNDQLGRPRLAFTDLVAWESHRISHQAFKSLIDILNETCRRALEAAAGLCATQTHYEVDIEHLLSSVPGKSVPDTCC